MISWKRSRRLRTAWLLAIEDGVTSQFGKNLPVLFAEDILSWYPLIYNNFEYFSLSQLREGIFALGCTANPGDSIV